MVFPHPGGEIIRVLTGRPFSRISGSSFRLQPRTSLAKRIYCIPKPTKPATCSFYGCMAKKICLEMYLTLQSIFYQQHIFIILHLRKLRHIQLIISSLLLQKLCRTSLLPDAALIYHKDTVCILNR